MKIVLKNGATYPIKRTNNNIAIPEKFMGFVGEIPENTKFAHVTDIILDTENELSNLFEIEKDFSLDNISDITFVTDSGSELKDSYDTIGRISQSISDYVNETTVVLVKYQK